ncbi:MAG TPA: DUF1572 family protein [Vicinamibacterales bacterium]|nr:DUF1572 family protein [Vicinamibacterales bacterium]
MNPGRLFLERARYFLGTEYRTQLRLAVEALPADALWWRANDESNSVGNLLLHLNGNVRQWMLSGVGGRPDVRHRAAEFSARSGPPADVLLDDLARTLDDVDDVLAGLTDEDLVQSRTIQGRDVSVLGAVFHVVEHFSQHLGQIILIAKLRAPGAINFHEDAGGLATPLWQARISRT